MASGPSNGRQRASSSSSSSANPLPLRNGGHADARKQQPDHEATQPRSSHTSDEFLRAFLNPSFDAAAFLNASLPPLAQTQGPSRGASRGGAPEPAPVPLAELSAQAQTLLSQLNAQTTRLSNTLTQLTDDILRSGSRLAYEVELLRGETLSLSETLNETLQDDVDKFVPGGLGRHQAAATGDDGQQQGSAEGTGAPSADGEDPDCIKQLQTLTLVRSRLESVIQTFGDAMEFTFPPSELSVSSSFLSVSAPEPGSQQQSSEEKGQQVLKELREEISGLLSKSEDDAVLGIEKAAKRIEELKELATVWKGTAEEKGRNKFIEGLAKMVEDRHRELMREMEQAVRREDRAAADAPATRRSGLARDAAAAEADDSRTLPGGFGLMSQLQRLRGGL